MSPDRNSPVEGVKEWRVATLSLILLAAMFTVLIGSHIVANSLLSIPWLLPEAEGALIGIPLALVVYLLIPRLIRIPREALFITVPSRSILRWTGVAVALVGAVTVGSVVGLSGILEVHVSDGRFLSRVLLSAVLLGLLAAITEELVFRGYLLSFIGHSWGWPAAIVLTSILFGLLHNGKVAGTGASELYVLVATSAGLLYALITYYTESVWNAVVLHAIWNTMFHTQVISIGPAETQPERAIVSYEYAEAGFLFGGNWATATISPFVLLILVVASATVLLGYRQNSI
ncbi:CPBP family intramembrane metalloprotease [Natronococcus sp. JC468]|uniref:CPBP family intramembrane glutamic endopeptidase n=1 Tax=Natronococcus sp. JC468 TaxID=1961921 RepID=UPI00143B9F2A|nr:type II CAAX endopeptidase family protein [Natronococcus sp. JC468]NKE36912.1 CPBP family intramembrane metalloprotease [Natronococcus sp. JC468]